MSQTHTDSTQAHMHTYTCTHTHSTHAHTHIPMSYAPPQGLVDCSEGLYLVPLPSSEQSLRGAVVVVVLSLECNLQGERGRERGRGKRRAGGEGREGKRVEDREVR